MKKFIASVALGAVLMAGFLFVQEDQNDVATGESHPPILQHMSSFSYNLY